MNKLEKSLNLILKKSSTCNNSYKIISSKTLFPTPPLSIHNEQVVSLPSLQSDTCITAPVENSRTSLESKFVFVLFFGQFYDLTS